MQALIPFSHCAFPFPFPLLNSCPLTLTLPFPLNCPLPSIPFSIFTPTWPCCHVSAGSILSLPLSHLPCWLKGKTVQPLASVRTLTQWIVAVEDLLASQTRFPWMCAGWCCPTTGSSAFLLTFLCSTVTWCIWISGTIRSHTLSQEPWAHPPG